jgi:glycosyltransferase involved in cell wall biosynthesis
VATDIGPIRELGGNDETLFLVPARDPGRLAEALARVAIDIQMRRVLCDVGKAWADKQFHPRVFARRYAELLLGMTGLA